LLYEIGRYPATVWLYPLPVNGLSSSSALFTWINCCYRAQK